MTFARIKHVSWTTPFDVPWQLVVWGDPKCAAQWDDAVTGVAMSAAMEVAFPSASDVNSDGTADHYFWNPEIGSMVIWDGWSLSANGFNPDVSVTDDRDGDGLPELWIRRGAVLATLYSATGRVTFERR